MSALIPLHFEKFDVRMILRGNVPWWVLNDLCVVAGFASPRNVAARLYDWQKDYVQISDAIGRLRRTLVVNEAGLYGMIIGSNKPEAEKFSRWLFTEVLPSIRRHGQYPPPAIALPAPVEVVEIENATQAQRFEQECRRLAAMRETSVEAMLGGLMSKPSLNAIFRGTANIPARLTRDAAWVQLLSLGMDLNYVLWGSTEATPAQSLPVVH